MNPILLSLLKDQQNKYPHILEDKFPRVFVKIMELWGTPQFDPFLSELFLDDSDGSRQGFPPDAMAELFFLSTLHDNAMKAKEAAKGDNVWANENVRRGLEEEHIEYSPAGFFSSLDIGNIHAIELFIEAGVDLEQRNSVGWTPLMMASFMGSEQVAILLTTAGADVNARDNRGYGPLHWASNQGYTQVTELLVQKGAFVNVKSDRGLTPLLQASARGHADIVRLLIAKGAIVNDADDEGWTPLHKAVANDHEEVVEVLMGAHADPYALHESGRTPVDIAKQKKAPEMMRKLTQRR